MTWCGNVAEHGWFVAGTLNPCFFYSLSTVALVAVAVGTSRNLATRLRSLDRIGRARSYLWTVPNSKTPHIVQTAAASILAFLHGITTMLLLGTATAPYMLLTQLTLTLVWIAVAVLLALTLQRNACSSLKHYSFVVGLLYALALYSEIQIFVHGLGISPFQRRLRLVGAVLGAVTTAVFIAAEICKPQEEPQLGEALRSALLEAQQEATFDAEHGANGTDSHATTSSSNGKRRRSRSWISLVGYAARYMWPDGFWLRVRAGACVLLILIMRLLNLAVPLLWKKVIDEFSALTAATHRTDGKPPETVPFAVAFVPWVAAWLGLYLLQGGGGGGGAIGLLSNVRSFLWIPISQNSFRRASLDIFTHVLKMDHAWHMKRRTGELMRVMDRGTASMQTLLGTVAFQIGPAMFDIVAAAIFLALRLKAWIAIIVFVTLSAYIPMTIALTEWRGKFRRELNALDNARGARATDALLNYETVKLFGNEKLEAKQYAAAIDAYQKVDFKLSASMAALNVLQSAVIWIGLVCGMVVCTAGVADGSLTVGDAVLFVSLVQQLYGPLNWFGTYYRMIQTSMLDMEGIFDLLTTKAGIDEDPHAVSLSSSSNAASSQNSTEEGENPHQVAFNDVSFAYADDGAPVLRNVSFVVPGGSTTALVGATGSGKSSILRLLLRFYDVDVGSVTIDGIDVRKVSMESLRNAIGVVPQDCVLFNDTIKYNIRYGRPEASDEEVVAAAEGASIHETISTRFPLGYDTIVGERGLRLSGGEKQRVAFARALLKNPAILVLDEATSALDSLTERRIQETLAKARQGRTVLVVAHRLSTIVNADRIVVMRGGEVAEMGTHEELVARPEGLYAELWARQAEASTSGGGGSTSRVASAAALASMVMQQREGTE